MKWVDMRDVQRPGGGHDDQSCAWTTQRGLRQSTAQLIEPPRTSPWSNSFIWSVRCHRRDPCSPSLSSDWAGMGFCLATDTDPVPVTISRAIETFRETGKRRAELTGHKRDWNVSRVRSTACSTVSTFNSVTLDALKTVPRCGDYIILTGPFHWTLLFYSCINFPFTSRYA